MEAPDNRGRRRRAGTERASTDEGPRRRVAKEAGRQLATSAKDQRHEALQSGANETAEVLRAPKRRAAERAEEASAGVDDLVEEARRRLEEHAAAGAGRVAESLRRLGDQGLALASGRPQDAPDIEHYVRQAADRLLEAARLADAVADDVAVRGIEGLVEHIGGLARRRPGLLVLATTAALFAAARTPTARLPGEAHADEENPARDHLEAAALDALLRAIWPGEVDQRSPAAGRQGSAGPGRPRQRTVRSKQRMGARPKASGRKPEAARPAKQGGSTPHSANRVRKTATRAAREVSGPEASTYAKDEAAGVPSRIEAEASPPSGARRNAKRAKATTESEPGTTTPVAKAPLAKGTSAASTGSARGRAPARHFEQ